MPRKPTELPPDVARRFLEDMRAYFAEPNIVKRDEIADRQDARAQGISRTAGKAGTHSRHHGNVPADEGSEMNRVSDIGVT
jgi:hypothetical protein